MSRLLEVRDLEVGYGQTTVVRQLNLEVARGEIVALFGANGAGKTTTIRGICALLPIRAGEVRLHGRTAPKRLHQLAQAGLGLITEERSIFMDLSVETNLELGRGDVARAYDTFPELRELRRRRAGLLSGGEQQMLTVGRALSRRIDVLIVDELSLGLSPLVITRLLAALRRAADEGLGVLLVEQRIDLAMRVADRCSVLVRGRLVLEGPTAELRTRLSEIHAAYLHQTVAHEESEEVDDVGPRSFHQGRHVNECEHPGREPLDGLEAE